MSATLVDLLAWPAASTRQSAQGWTWVAGPREHALLTYDEAADEATQWRLLESLPTRLPAPVLAIFRDAGEWHVVAPSRPQDGRLRLTRLRVPDDGAAPTRLAALRWERRPPDVVKLLDPLPLRRTALRALLAARQGQGTNAEQATSRDARANALPAAPGTPARLLAAALETVFPAAPGWALAPLAALPVTLREDTPEQVECAITPHVLEWVYEALAWSGRGERQGQGSWHTPTRLVYHMVRETIAASLVDQGLDPDTAQALVGGAALAATHTAAETTRPGSPLAAFVPQPRIIDPSVGPGSFLVAAGTVLLDLAEALALDGRRVLEQSLHGVDISPLALDVCRCRIRLLAASRGLPELRIALVEGNSLVDGLPPARFVWHAAFKETFRDGGFDVAIGNPPYLRDSRKKNLPADLPRLYRSATSHYDLYALFMERSLQIVRPGGRICLLTSNRYLAQKYGRGIRELLLEHDLESVVDLDFRAFDAGVTTCITTARKRSPDDASKLLLQRVSAEEDLPSRFRTPPNVERERLRQLPGCPFRIDLGGEDMALARRLEQDAVPFRELGFVSLGMVFHEARPGGRRKQHYLSPERTPPFTIPLVDGEHVRRWRFSGRLWLDYRPTEHREPRFPELFDPPKLVCRRIIGRHRIMAVPDESGLYFSDNAVGFVPWHALRDCGARVVRGQANGERVTRSAGVDLYYLAAVLNSRLLSWYYRTLLGFGVHFYPAHLKHMPVRIASAQDQGALADLAREAASAWSSAPQAPTRAQQARLDRLDDEIDRRVERLYDLTAREASLLEG